MTPEGRVKDKVKALLKEFGAYWFMPVQNGMGSPSLDMVIHFGGRTCWVETKAAGKTLTPRQEMTREEIEKRGIPVFVIDGDLAQLRNWLSEGALLELCVAA